MAQDVGAAAGSGGIRRAQDGAVLRLTIDRPDKKNALDHAMYAALDAGFEAAASDPGVRAVLLAGAGGTFTSGNDLADFAAPPHADGGPVQRLIRRVIGFEKPIVAAVEGLAIGIGTTVLLHCDVVVASREARFRMPFTDLGLVPEFASSLMLTRLAGLQRASDLLLTGRMFDASEAERLGLVARLVEPGGAEAGAMEAASAIAAKPPEAIAITRRLLRGGVDEVLARNEEEARLFRERLGSREAQAAFAAFFARKRG